MLINFGFILFLTGMFLCDSANLGKKSTENLGIMGHFPGSSYGLGLSSRLLQAPFCDFSSKKEVSSILLPKKWYSEYEGRPKRAYAVKQKSLPEAEEILSKSAKQMLAL